MKQEELNEQLAKAISKYSLMIGYRATKGIVDRLPTCSEWRTVVSKESDAFLNARNAVMETGRVLLEDREQNTIEGIIYAGVGNMNPAIVVVRVFDNSITISAFAKEGVIKQHTAKKAIDRFVSAL